MPRVNKLPRFSNPGDCLMFPGRVKDDRGFYMFDRTLDGPTGDMHVGISGEGLRTIAARHGSQFGIALREQLENAVADAEVQRKENAALREQVAELEDFKSKVQGLTVHGFDVKRRQGRPPVKKED